MRPRFSKAFSLVELLVVAAILSILAALLLPTLKKAREMGMVAACAGNLRQIGAATLCYAGDYEGFPLAPDGWKFVGNNYWTSLSSLSEYGYLGPPAKGKGNPVFLCPWLQRNYKVYPGNSGNHGGGQVNYSTSFLLGFRTSNDWVRLGSGTGDYSYKLKNTYGPYRLSEIRNPARCFLAGDAVAFPTSGYAGYDAACAVTWGGGNDRLIGDIQTWDLTWKLGVVTHGGPNLLFWDGHVERYIYPVGATANYPANYGYATGLLRHAFPWERTTSDGASPQ